MMLSFSGVTKTYKHQAAVSDLSFTIEPESITALIGMNGAGKTTTMEILMGHLTKTGEVTLWGKDSQEVVSGSYPGRIYYVPENKTLPCDILLRDLLDICAGQHKDGMAIDRVIVDRLLKDMSLTCYLDQKITELSPGQKTGLFILIGLASNAELLVLDEPLSGLDPFIRNLIIRELKSSCWKGRSVFYSSHILEEVETVADKVIILHKGQNLYDGSIDELKEKYFEIILENPENIDAILKKKSVIDFKTNAGGMINLFIDKQKYNNDINGKKYLLNLKEIFLYLVNGENKAAEE